MEIPTEYIERAKELIASHHTELQRLHRLRQHVPKNDDYVMALSNPCSKKELTRWIYAHTELVPSGYLETLADEVDISLSLTPKDGQYGYNFYIMLERELHELWVVWIMARYGYHYDDYEEVAIEQTRRELLKYTRDSRSQPMTKNELQKAFYPFFVKHAKFVTWDWLYNEHLSGFDERTPLAKRDISTGEIRRKASTQHITGRSPWKTKRKIESYAERSGWNYDDVVTELANRKSDSFNMREQRQYMCHFYGARYTFVIDYMFAGMYVYLVAINMNTRKAYAIPAHRIIETEQNWRVPEKLKENAHDAVESLKKLISQAGTVKYLVSDQETIWKSDQWKDFLKSRGIEHKMREINYVSAVIETPKTDRGVHSYTSLVDRLIRTLRMMAYNMGRKQSIDPDLMAYLVNEYNNSPHATLSKYLERPITPNEVDKDYSLEEEFVRRLAVHNFAVRTQSDYKPVKTVRVYNEAHSMDKVKPKLLPGQWQVLGQKNGLWRVKQNNTEMLVNRWMLKNEF